MTPPAAQPFAPSTKQPLGNHTWFSAFIGQAPSEGPRSRQHPGFSEVPRRKGEEWAWGRSQESSPPHPASPLTWRRCRRLWSDGGWSRRTPPGEKAAASGAWAASRAPSPSPTPGTHHPADGPTDRVCLELAVKPARGLVHLQSRKRTVPPPTAPSNPAPLSPSPWLTSATFIWMDAWSLAPMMRLLAELQEVDAR